MYNVLPGDTVVLIQNDDSKPWTGTATGMLSAPDLGVPFLSKITLGATPVDPQDAKQVYLVGHHKLAEHASGAGSAFFVGIYGTFRPGTTAVRLAPKEWGVVDPTYRVPTIELLRSARLTITERFGDALVDTIEVPLLDEAQFEILALTQTFAEVRCSFALPSGNQVQVYNRYLHGEIGTRWKVVIENRGKTLFTAGAAHKHVVIEKVELSVPWEQTMDTVSVEPLGHVQLSDPASLPPNAVSGPWGVRFGNFRPYLTIKGDKGRAVCTLFEAGPGRAIPTGNTPSAPTATFGDPIATTHVPGSDTYLMIEGGKRAIWEGVLGHGYNQRTVDFPPQLRWKDVRNYRCLVGAGTVHDNGDGNTDRLFQRIERQLDAWFKAERADEFQSGQPLVALPEFNLRGGTYPVSGGKKNRLLTYRDFGATFWGGGYANLTHYNIGGSAYREYLRDGDIRYLYMSMGSGMLLTASGYSADYGHNQQYHGFAYESGMSDHGRAQPPNATHEWDALMVFKYLQEMDFVAKQMADDFAIHLQGFDNTLKGTPVPTDWVIGTDKDPRDWAAPSGIARYGRSTGAGAGWFGDFGQRKPARILDNAVYLLRCLGNKSMIQVLQNVCKEVLRVELTIWGGQGALFNRAERSHGFEDNEQPWEATALWRAVGSSILALRQFGAEVPAGIEAMYQRGVSHVLKTLIFGVPDASGAVVPMRPVGIYTQFNPTEMVVRDGQTSATEAKLKSFIANATQTNAASLLDEWHVAWLMDTARVRADGSQYWRYPKLLEMDSLALRMSTSLAMGRPVAEADLARVNAIMSSISRRVLGFGTNHATGAADLFAQAFLSFGRTDVETPLLELAKTMAWHHQDGGKVQAYANPWDQPSGLGYRMTMYPGAESKVCGPHMDIANLLDYMDQEFGLKIAPASFRAVDFDQFELLEDAVDPVFAD